MEVSLALIKPAGGSGFPLFFGSFIGFFVMV